MKSGQKEGKLSLNSVPVVLKSELLRPDHSIISSETEEISQRSFQMLICKNSLRSQVQIADAESQRLPTLE